MREKLSRIRIFLTACFNPFPPTSSPSSSPSSSRRLPPNIISINKSGSQLHQRKEKPQTLFRAQAKEGRQQQTEKQLGFGHHHHHHHQHVNNTKSKHHSSEKIARVSNNNFERINHSKSSSSTSIIITATFPTARRTDLKSSDKSRSSMIVKGEVDMMPRPCPYPFPPAYHETKQQDPHHHHLSAAVRPAYATSSAPEALFWSQGPPNFASVGSNTHPTSLFGASAVTPKTDVTQMNNAQRTCDGETDQKSGGGGLAPASPYFLSPHSSSTATSSGLKKSKMLTGGRGGNGWAPDRVDSEGDEEEEEDDDDEPKKIYIQTFHSPAAPIVIPTYLHCEMSSAQAEKALMNKSAGSYLIRNSSTDPKAKFVLSVTGRNHTVIHYRVFRNAHGLLYISVNGSKRHRVLFHILQDLVEYYGKNPLVSRNNLSNDVYLKSPVHSRKHTFKLS